ncbi:hypothetical protein [Cochleicola gelatinilyticus]|uniref:Membrane or secreted protein n=1 Tax=Cochleicola gelatinilyticus TaxID=1763537 RepID=A0A167JDV8_9FLAO|nr:hypothetical protein [Cochleicola gelatinilyticus]OAB80574.1 hypothetical protein ULVI_07540 [Cochleicola gelatinilyticus]
MKKYLVLGVLFLLPITAYIFFASGVNNFAKLPVVTANVSEITSFQTSEGNKVQLKNNITVLGFFGKDLLANKAYAFNLAHKIYVKNHQFEDFQFVILLPEGSQAQAKELKEKLSEIESMDRWKFAFGTSEEIEKTFNSLDTKYSLDNNTASPFVFIIDKDRNLRGRSDDEDDGTLYGFDSRDIAEINNKMTDDIKVVLAEYRLALKKNNNARRKI